MISKECNLECSEICIYWCIREIEIDKGNKGTKYIKGFRLYCSYLGCPLYILMMFCGMRNSVKYLYAIQK